MRFGAIEAGGTKMVLGIGNEHGQILDSISIPTGLPEDTLPRMIDYFRQHPVSAIGVASFGPVDLCESSATYGHITATPKPGWRDFPLVPRLREALEVPMGFDTDVNAAVLGEVRYGAARGLSDCLYLTVGTGIGGGLYSGGKLVHGLQHPEWGHVPLRPVAEDTAPDGFCPYHKACGEGLASGPAMEKRWGMKAQLLPKDHIAWQIEAEYLSQLCAIAMYTVSPQMILLGGGVMGAEQLLPMIREKTSRLIGGYLTFSGMEDMNRLIRRPALYPVSGLVGALELARDALDQ